MNEWDKLKEKRPKPRYKQMGTYGEYYFAVETERYFDGLEDMGDKLQLENKQLAKEGAYATNQWKETIDLWDKDCKKVKAIKKLLTDGFLPKDVANKLREVLGDE